MMNVLHNDSQGATHLTKNSMFYLRTKHITFCYHFIKYLLEDEVLTLVKIKSNKNVVNISTKIVTIDKLKLYATSVG